MLEPCPARSIVASIKLVNFKPMAHSIPVPVPVALGAVLDSKSHTTCGLIISRTHKGCDDPVAVSLYKIPSFKSMDPHVDSSVLGTLCENPDKCRG